MEKRDLEYELNALCERYNRIFALFTHCEDEIECYNFKLCLWNLYLEMDLLKRLIKTYFLEENNPEQGEDKNNF